MYSNVGLSFNVKRNLPLAVVYMHQELGLHTIELPDLSNMSFYESSSRCGIATTNSTSECVNDLLSNFISQYDVANTDIIIEARN